MDRRKEIDQDIANLPKNYVTGRQRLMKSYGPELETLREDIALYTKQIRDNMAQIAKLKATNLQEEVHVGPIIFVAKAFNRDTDEAVKWLIIIIMFAFDPFAVALTIGTNQALIDKTFAA